MKKIIYLTIKNINIFIVSRHNKLPIDLIRTSHLYAHTKYVKKIIIKNQSKKKNCVKMGE